MNDGVSWRTPKKEELPSLAIDTEYDKGTQTQRGFWIDETSIPPHHRSLAPGSLDNSEQATKQVKTILLQVKRSIIWEPSFKD